MKTYTVKIEVVGIEAKTKEEAKRAFWEIVDDSDYSIEPTVEEEVTL